MTVGRVSIDSTSTREMQNDRFYLKYSTTVEILKFPM